MSSHGSLLVAAANDKLDDWRCQESGEQACQWIVHDDAAGCGRMSAEIEGERCFVTGVIDLLEEMNHFGRLGLLYRLRFDLCRLRIR